MDKKLVNGLKAASKRLDAFAKKCFAVAKQAALRGLIGIFAGLTAAILGAVQAVSRTHTGGAGIPTVNYTNTLVRIKNNTGQVLERHGIGV